MVCRSCADKPPRNRCYGCPLGRNVAQDWDQPARFKPATRRTPRDDRSSPPEDRAPRLWLPAVKTQGAKQVSDGSPFLPNHYGSSRDLPETTVSTHEFLEAVTRFRPSLDPDQGHAIELPWNAGVCIVAGPGTGKTSTLVLRILKVIFVDGIPPGSVMATTFTRKAAAELRSRVLAWGFRLQQELLGMPGLAPEVHAFVRSVDLNKARTGTIDSLGARMLREHRPPSGPTPALAAPYSAKAIMRRHGFFMAGLDKDPMLERLLLGLHSATRDRFGFDAHRKGELLSELWERRFHDVVAWDDWVAAEPDPHGPRHLVDDAHAAYLSALEERNLVDYVLLQARVLEAIRAGDLDPALAEIEVLLVDEYQDTNLLQEQLYFEIVSRCGGAITVVGDDDQSLYRFRGATVDLFSRFPERYDQRFGRRAESVFLTFNYRSSAPIVRFVNDFVTMDADHRSVRSMGKPILQQTGNTDGHPVYAMFRANEEILARDLANLIWNIFRGTGGALPAGLVVADPDHGDVGDCVVLSHSPSDVKYDRQLRLPHLLRLELEAKPSPVRVFNPRGETLGFNPTVSVLGGLLLYCLDPDGSHLNQSFLSEDVPDVLTVWRERAKAVLSLPIVPHGLSDYVNAWRNRSIGRPGWTWARETPGLELFYALVQFFPSIVDDPEQHLYLEAFARQFSECAQVTRLRGAIITDTTNRDLSDRSVRALIENVLAPIAERKVDIDEDLLVAYPRDRLPIMSIHQAKGLEFPITIVDVGSDILRAHKANAFKRFPETGETAHRMEDLLRTHSTLGATERSQVNRGFDDLYRKFFVAFSRPQHILILAGCNGTRPEGEIPHVATGTTRYEHESRWRDRPPFTYI